MNAGITLLDAEFSVKKGSKRTSNHFVITAEVTFGDVKKSSIYASDVDHCLVVNKAAEKVSLSTEKASLVCGWQSRGQQSCGKVSLSTEKALHICGWQSSGHWKFQRISSPCLHCCVFNPGILWFSLKLAKLAKNWMVILPALHLAFQIFWRSNSCTWRFGWWDLSQTTWISLHIDEKDRSKSDCPWRRGRQDLSHWSGL